MAMLLSLGSSESPPAGDSGRGPFREDGNGSGRTRCDPGLGLFAHGDEEQCMTADHREIEDKYDLDHASVLPDFSTLPRVRSVSTAEQELTATYFDTPDLALARAGVVLRRRTGGEDAGWHVKLPMAGARLEIAVPLGRAVRNPPVALRQVVAGLARDQRLSPVVTIHTDRVVHRLHDQGGVVLAEVSDDRVSAEAVDPEAPGPALTTWREAEVELVTGGRSLLEEAAALLTTVGARPSDSASKLARALGDRLAAEARPALPTPTKKGPASAVIQLRLLEQVEALRRLDPWVRHDAPEAVHDMRVAVRRVRNALASYRPFLDSNLSEPLRDELGWLAALLGGPRDSEVLHEVLRSLVADEPPDLVRGPVAARIDRDVHAQYDSARADLIAGLASPRYHDLVDHLVAFAERPPWTDLADEQARRVLPQRLDADWKRLRTRVRVAAGADVTDDPVGHADLLHGVRKAAKRVRYAAEALVPLYGKDATRMVNAHEQIQTVLGDHHDDTEAQSALLELGDRAAEAGENAFTYGLLYARVHARGCNTAREFERAWRRSVRAREQHRVG
jgi:CHAD domain-containing protein